MEHSNEMSPETAARRAAVAGLAVVGFFALVFIGIVLAIYAARLIPRAANGFSDAAVYLSSIFTPGANPSLQSVPSSVPFGNAATTTTATTAVATSTAGTGTTGVATTATQPKPTTGTHYTTPSAGPSTEVASPIPGSGSNVSGSTGGNTNPATYYGLANLTPTITAVGYVDNNGNFIPSNTVTNSQKLAVQFTIANTGTNTTGNAWHFSVLIPTQHGQFTYDSPTQPPMNPGDHTAYTLHIDAGQAYIGTDSITVTADNLHEVNESNENNNVASTGVTVVNG